MSDEHEKRAREAFETWRAAVLAAGGDPDAYDNRWGDVRLFAHEVAGWAAVGAAKAEGVREGEKKAKRLLDAARAVAVPQPASGSRGADDALRWSRFYEAIHDMVGEPVASAPAAGAEVCPTCRGSGCDLCMGTGMAEP